MNGRKQDEELARKVNFHIDGVDDRGHTFLMVASCNNDVETVQLCLDLGADKSAMNPDGLTAIHYSHVFGFDAVTDVILQHGGSRPRS